MATLGLIFFWQEPAWAEHWLLLQIKYMLSSPFTIFPNEPAWVIDSSWHFPVLSKFEISFLWALVLQLSLPASCLLTSHLLLLSNPFCLILWSPHFMINKLISSFNIISQFLFYFLLLGVELCPQKICWSPKPQCMWMWSYLEITSLQMYLK